MAEMIKAKGDDTVSKNSLRWIAFFNFIVGIISYHVDGPMNAVYWVLVAIFVLLWAD